MPELENDHMTAEEYRQQTDSEADIHKAVVEWADRQAKARPELALLFHPPNGGSRHIAEATKLKAMGVRKGVPDLLLPCSGPMPAAWPWSSRAQAGGYGVRRRGG